METTLITIVGLAVGILQGLIILVLTGIKTDCADIWKRMNSHYHEVSCGNDGCKSLKTGNVVIPRS